MAGIDGSDMVSQNLQSCLSTSKFLKQFLSKEDHKNTIVANAGILALLVNY